MIKLKCTCGATLKIAQGPVSRLRFADDWLTQHGSCREEYWAARHEDQQSVMAIELERRDTCIKDLEKDTAFYRSCLYSGETPAPGDEPSARYAVVSPPTIGATENES